MTSNDPRRLLDAARQIRVVTPGGQSLGRKRLLRALTTGTLTATAATALTAETSLASAAVLGTTGSTTAVATGSLWGLAGSAVTVGVLTGALVFSPGSSVPDERPVAASASVKRLVVPPSQSRPTAGVPSPVGVQLPTVVAEPKPEASPASSVTKRERLSIEEETRLLQRVQGAQRRGLYNDALTLLAEHERRFKAPRLAEEAMALRVLVHCDAGQISTAKRWAQLFHELHASSAQLGRLKSSCPQAFQAGSVPRKIP